VGLDDLLDQCLRLVFLILHFHSTAVAAKTAFAGGSAP
jgi:hypothetical protein